MSFVGIHPSPSSQTTFPPTRNLQMSKSRELFRRDRPHPDFGFEVWGFREEGSDFVIEFSADSEEGEGGSRDGYFVFLGLAGWIFREKRSFQGIRRSGVVARLALRVRCLVALSGGSSGRKPSGVDAVYGVVEQEVVVGFQLGGDAWAKPSFIGRGFFELHVTTSTSTLYCSNCRAATAPNNRRKQTAQLPTQTTYIAHYPRFQEAHERIAEGKTDRKTRDSICLDVNIMVLPWRRHERAPSIIDDVILIHAGTPSAIWSQLFHYSHVSYQQASITEPVAAMLTLKASFIFNSLLTNYTTCGQEYEKDISPARDVYIHYGDCKKSYKGFALAKANDPDTWAAPVVQFHTATHAFRTDIDPFLATLDTILWVAAIPTFAGPLMVSGLTEAACQLEMVLLQELRHCNRGVKQVSPNDLHHTWRQLPCVVETTYRASLELLHLILCFLSVFTALGGTIMLITGVYGNCFCYVHSQITIRVINDVRARIGSRWDPWLLGFMKKIREEYRRRVGMETFSSWSHANKPPRSFYGIDQWDHCKCRPRYDLYNEAGEDDSNGINATLLT
ncbi:uncharacterized protein MYCFIDRAFT_172832 [Pseudocercospora fijiensis CIRAD86]|uniref:Uncharacterized protein n=1 Tax=Pseudocercospora fijiensis (strain CIRAD86) TaxID=383855 RepID=M2Z1S4_PSEFD|nr:uncharacterized protein MYCFIDRAFT_172832 [Pseudocercospora fijiensis CIRAD86]EME83755.1 hypothetical protein MYCFIDRAFT_172832 [Pseudocercospora fijiensis CIRAD86]